MEIGEPDRFDLTPKEAAALQRRLRDRVVDEDDFERWPPRLIAGADVAYSTLIGVVVGAVSVMSFPELALVEEAGATQPAAFPYVPGLLSFREVPAIVAAFEKLTHKPEVVLFDGHGFAHPRRFGLASHGGLRLGVVSVGVAKSILTGRPDAPLGEARGSKVPLTADGEVVGVALRTRARVAPVYVSVGHRVSLGTAASLALDCAPRYRICEPIRRAHALASKERSRMEAECASPG